MLFNSIEYLFFLPIVFICYWSLSNHLKLQNSFLLLASYFFYGLWSPKFLILIIFSSAVDFLVGLQLQKESNNRRRKYWLWLSLAVNLGLLGVFKYFNFFIDSFVDFAALFGMNPSVTTLQIILPVGISFYTFQTLSYTIDIYHKRLKATRNWLNFFTYVAFFPQLVAGPIERASRLLPQIENNRIFDYKKGKDGMLQILWGLFKKVVIADNCAVFVDPIFADYGEMSSLTLIIGAVLFTFQIYCDFSGYSDIAIGMAKLLGIDLMQNFATPYFSRNIAEFWRRWHISLSTWFRDYLYIPLGGSRVSKILQTRNIFAIFLVSGFWHGANITFLFWGLIHALCYLPQVFAKTNRKYLDAVAVGRWLPNLKEIYLMLQTFLIVTVAWVFFRSPSITDGFLYLKHLVTNDFIGKFPKMSENSIGIISLFGFIGTLLFIEWLNRTEKHGLKILPKSLLIRYPFYLALCLLILEFFSGQKEFIYFQF